MKFTIKVKAKSSTHTIVEHISLLWLQATNKGFTFTNWESGHYYLHLHTGKPVNKKALRKFFRQIKPHAKLV